MNLSKLFFSFLHSHVQIHSIEEISKSQQQGSSENNNGYGLIGKFVTPHPSNLNNINRKIQSSAEQKNTDRIGVSKLRQSDSRKTLVKKYIKKIKL